MAVSCGLVAEHASASQGQICCDDCTCYRTPLSSSRSRRRKRGSSSSSSGAVAVGLNSTSSKVGVVVVAATVTGCVILTNHGNPPTFTPLSRSRVSPGAVCVILTNHGNPPTFTPLSRSRVSSGAVCVILTNHCNPPTFTPLSRSRVSSGAGCAGDAGSRSSSSTSDRRTQRACASGTRSCSPWWSARRSTTGSCPVWSRVSSAPCVWPPAPRNLPSRMRTSTPSS